MFLEFSVLTEEKPVAEGVGVAPAFHREAHVLPQVCLTDSEMKDGGAKKRLR